MATSKTWPSTGSTNVTPTSYSIPQAGNVNWPSLTDFLVALANGAQSTTFQRFALRVATTTPVTISTNDCAVQTNMAITSAVAVTLPAGVNKQYFIISDGKGDAATNNITITPNVGETIGGASTLVLNSNNAAVLLAFQSSDNDWKIMMKSEPNKSWAPYSIILPDGEIIIGNSSGVGQARTMSGDITIGDTGITAISSGVIVDGDINAAAAIAGTKINPNFGAQTIITTGNVVCTNSITASANTAAAGGTTSLTPTSARVQILTGTGNQTFQMPNAHSLAQNGTTFEFNNNATGTLTVTDQGSNTICTVPSGGYARVICTDTSTTNGTWDKHFLIPANVQWGTSGLPVSSLGALTTSRALVSDGSGFVSAATTTSTQIGYLSSATGTTGTTSTNLVFSTSPTLVTPILGAATATTINKVTITTPAIGSTLTIADGKTFTVSNSLTFTGTDTNSFAFPNGSSTVMTLASVDTISGAKTFNDGKLILAGSSSGTSTLKAQATAGTTTFTLPTTTGTLVGSGDTGTITSTMILDGTIVNADINASAAIAGTKISPNFGSQNIATTGVYSGGATTITTPGIFNAKNASTSICGYYTEATGASSIVTGIRMKNDVSEFDITISASTLFIQNTGVASRFELTTAGALRLNAYSTGIAHFDSSGNITSSTIVNADVSSSAAIAGSKIQAATTSNAGVITLKSPTVTVFGSATSGTYTVPAGVLWLEVKMVGGGGGGGGSGTASAGTGGTGGNTTFGTTFLVCNGGVGGGAGGNGGGAGGTTSIGAGAAGEGITGGDGCGVLGFAAASFTIFCAGGNGGSSAFGGAGKGGDSASAGTNAHGNSGSGGGGGGYNGTASGNTGGGGGAGGFINAIIAAPGASYSYTVGAAGTAGTAGTSGFAGGTGSVGLITIFEHYY